MAATNIIPVDPDGRERPVVTPPPDPRGPRYPAMAEALLKRGLIDQPQNVYDAAGNLARTWAMTRVADGRGGTLGSVLAQALGDGQASRLGGTMPSAAAGDPAASQHNFAYGREMPAGSVGGRYRSTTRRGIGWNPIR